MMARPDVTPTGQERFFGDDEIIVSKTDSKGRITYANKVFLRIAGYDEAGVIGAPHNIIRHPDMPRAVFRLLWETVSSGQEIFAYVKNMARNGDHYWVIAHVTPTIDAERRVLGYHSNRRPPNRAALAVIEPLYDRLRTIEQRGATPGAALEMSSAALQAAVEDSGVSYDEFVFRLEDR